MKPPKRNIYTSVSEEVVKLLDRDADDAVRSRAAQIEYIIKQYYEEELAQRISNSKRNREEVSP